MACITYRTFFSRCLAMVGIQMKWVHRSCKNAVIHPPLPKDTRATMRCFWGIPRQLSNVAAYRDSVLLGYPTAALKRRRVSRFGASGVSHCGAQTSPGIAIRCFWGIPLQLSNVAGYGDSVLLGYPTAALKRHRVSRFSASGVHVSHCGAQTSPGSVGCENLLFASKSITVLQNRIVLLVGIAVFSGDCLTRYKFIGRIGV